jgi:hypothetical protein
LNDFPIYAGVLARLQEDLEKLNRAVKEVDELTTGAGVPKFTAAVDRIRTDLSGIKTDLTLVARRMGEIASLTDLAGEAGGEKLRPLHDITKTLPPLISALQEAVGNVGAPMPEDVGSSLKRFADEGVEANRAIQSAVREIENFARQHPAITDHRLWSVESPMGGGLALRYSVTSLLADLGAQFGDLRLQILGLLDRGDPQRMNNAIKSLREFTARLEANFRLATESLSELAERLAHLDNGSAAVLDQARNEGFLKPQAEAIDTLLARLDDLPELQLGTIADDLNTDNIIVVEAGDKVRIVRYDEVWPIRQVIQDPSISTEERPRAFNGDASLSSALLALTRERPFATVVMTTFAPQPQQTGRAMMPPPRPSIASEDLQTIRQRLEAANFKVVNWDLSSDDPAPAPEEGTENIYLVLPPAPASPPNPFGGPPPTQPFGEGERRKLVDAIGVGGRAIFLITWDVRPAGPFGFGLETPPYDLADLLRSQWGIGVRNEYRITWVIPDSRRPDQIGVSASRFQMIPANYFTNHPIGKPLASTTVALTDACPLEIIDPPSTGVKVEKILEIPSSEEYLAADLRSLIKIIEEINNPETGGFVQRPLVEHRPPYTVMAAATRTVAAETEGEPASTQQAVAESRIVVCGFGRSFADFILGRPVLRELPDGRLVASDPPTTNAELLVNALFWLLGQEQWIGAGPPAAPSIRAIQPEWMFALRTLTYGVWPAAIFASGLFIWYARRR